jgi:TPR repeat protein
MLNLALALFLAADAAAGGDFAALCDTGNGEACNRLAIAHHDGRGAPQDLKKAEVYYGKACQAGYGVGCQNLGELQAQLATEDSVRRARASWARAAQLYREACDKGSLELCVNLGTLYEGGRLVPEGAPRDGDAQKKDLLTAAGLYDRACARGDVGGCVNLASLHSDGRGVPKDGKKARSFLKVACNGLERAVTERARSEAAGACGNLALLVQATNPQQSVPLHRKACEGGYAGACGNLGVLLSHCKSPKWRFANALFRRGCDGGDGISCWNLALSFEGGFGTTRDPAEARSLRERACKMGLQEACR